VWRARIVLGDGGRAWQDGDHAKYGQIEAVRVALARALRQAAEHLHRQCGKIKENPT
jgi:hypothetical protein